MFGTIVRDFETIVEKMPGMVLYNYPDLNLKSTVWSGTEVELILRGRWYIVTFVDPHGIRWYFRMNVWQRMEYVEKRECTQSPFVFPTVVAHAKKQQR